MAWYQGNTWGYTYPAVEEAPDQEARLIEILNNGILELKRHHEYQLKREEEWRVIWTCSNCGEYGHFTFACKNVEATDVREMVQQEAEKDSTIPEEELQEQMVQTLTIPVFERDTVVDNEDVVMSLSDADELPDPLDEEEFEQGANVRQREVDFTYVDHVHVNAVYDFQPHFFDPLPQGCNPSWRSNPTFVWSPDDEEEAVIQPCSYSEVGDPLDEEKMDMEFLASLEDGPTEIVEEPTMSTTETLSDAEQNNISISLVPIDVHSHYIIASDTFFSNDFLQGVDSDVGEVTPAPVANLSVGERSTRENGMSSIPSIPSILGPTDLENEDELVQVMEWLKLESEFG